LDSAKLTSLRAFFVVKTAVAKARQSALPQQRVPLSRVTDTVKDLLRVKVRTLKPPAATNCQAFCVVMDRSTAVFGNRALPPADCFHTAK
jgi:hypothetical protein